LARRVVFVGACEKHIPRKEGTTSVDRVRKRAIDPASGEAETRLHMIIRQGKSKGKKLKFPGWSGKKGGKKKIYRTEEGR